MAAVASLAAHAGVSVIACLGIAMSIAAGVVEVGCCGWAADAAAAVAPAAAVPLGENFLLVAAAW